MSVRSLLISAALLVLATPLHAEPKSQPLRDEDVVARVNGTAIYRKSVRELVQGYLLAQDSRPDPASIGKLAEDALDSLIALELLYQESQARNVAVTDAAVEDEIGRTKSQFADPHAFESAMKAKGMTERQLRLDTRKTMAVNRLLEGTVLKDVKITPEQIKEFYEQNKEEFKHPAQLRASHILIRVAKNATAAEREAAKQRATALLEKLKSGADFAQLAIANSQDPVTTPQGGDLGYIAKGEMDDAFEKAAFALQAGQLSGIVSTPYGFDIIKVTERREAGYEPLNEAENRIREVLLKTERQQRQATFVTELRKKAKLEFSDRSQP